MTFQSHIASYKWKVSGLLTSSFISFPLSQLLLKQGVVKVFPVSYLEFQSSKRNHRGQPGVAEATIGWKAENWLFVSTLCSSQLCATGQVT